MFELRYFQKQKKISFSIFTFIFFPMILGCLSNNFPKAIGPSSTISHRLEKSWSMLVMGPETQDENLERINFIHGRLKESAVVETSHSSKEYFHMGPDLRHSENTPMTPILHTYHRISPPVLFVAKLPSSFRFNIPSGMKETLGYFDLDHLDIFWVMQEWNENFFGSLVGDSQISLKPGYWVYGEKLPKEITEITLPGSLEHHQVYMEISNSNKNIQAQVKENEFNAFDIVAHDGRISPDTGHLNINHDQLNLSFFSLVIFPKEKRAAVTWHVVYDYKFKKFLLRNFKKNHSVYEIYNHFPNQLKKDLKPNYKILFKH